MRRIQEEDEEEKNKYEYPQHSDGEQISTPNTRLPELFLFLSTLLLVLAIWNWVRVEYHGMPDVSESLFRFTKEMILGDLDTGLKIYVFDREQKSTKDTCSNDDLLLTSEIIDAYRQDGVVAMRNVISQDVLETLVAAGDKLVRTNNDRRMRGNTQFHSVKVGAIFMEGEVGEAFRNVALEGYVPKIAAKLNQIEVEEHECVDDKNRSEDVFNLRLLRDVFLAKDNGEYVCGWHVDDYGFWPADTEYSGVNAWITLDDISVDMGGGFAVSPGSHNADWNEDAFHATGATPTFPKEGFQNVSDFFENRVGEGTCNLKRSAPHINEILEANKRIYDLKKGDIIFMTRWLWHRTIPFHKSLMKSNLIFKRYSIRYSQGKATVPKGYGTELSVLWDSANAGECLNDVHGGPWYPQVFPNTLKQEQESLMELSRKHMKDAQLILRERRKEMKPYLAKLGQKI